jgi:C-terminal processing protease CtpA/Prc
MEESMLKQDARASAQGRELYRKIWSDVRNGFFAADRLANWHRFEHKFDSEIVDRKSALACIDKMLAALGDCHTHRLTKKELTARDTLRAGNDPSVMARRLRENNEIGYIGIDGFDADTFDQLQSSFEQLAACRALIIDLRENVGGLLDAAVNCCELVVPEGPICTLEFRDGNGWWKREVGFTDSVYIVQLTAPNGVEEIEGYKRRPHMLGERPVVLLINEGTASAAEVFASALIKNAAPGQVVVIGTRSHGKGIGQETVTYPDGTAIKMSLSRFFGADNSWFGDCGQTTSNGIVPNETVRGIRRQFVRAVARTKEMIGQLQPGKEKCDE